MALKLVSIKQKNQGITNEKIDPQAQLDKSARMAGIYDFNNVRFCHLNIVSVPRCHLYTYFYNTHEY